MSLKSNVAAPAAALIVMVTSAVASGAILGSEGATVGGFVHSGTADSVSTLMIALAAGASAPAAAEDARGAAIQRCNAEARKHYRGIYYSWGDVRDFAYKHCLFDAGFPE
jgi:hypothetical protein